MEARKVGFRGTALVLGLVVGLGAAELLLRSVDLGAISKAPPPMFVDRELVFHQHDPDPRLGYRLRPGASGSFQGAQVRVNELGCRGPSSEPSTATGPLVISLGDSIAFGAGVEEKDTFSHQLELLLNKNLPGLRVLNCGVSGYNLEQVMQSYRLRLRDLQPDLVVLSLFADDLFPPYRLEDHSAASWLRGHVALFRAVELSPLWLGPRGNRDLPSWAEDREAYSAALRQDFAAWQQELEAQGTALLAVHHPFLHRQQAVPGGPAELLTRTMTAYGVPLVQLRPVYDEAVSGSLLALSTHPESNDPHPNARGHALVAEALEKKALDLLAPTRGESEP